MRTIFLFISIFFVVVCSAQSADEYYQLGKEAYDKKEYSSSVDYFSKAINLSPDVYSYWFRGSAYWALMNYAKSSDDYSRALLYATNNDDKATLLSYRADCEYLLLDYRSAVNDYRDYLKLVPGKSRAYNELGRALLELKDFVGAKEAFSNAMLLADTDANRAIYKYNIGLTEINFLNYRAAGEAFTEAIKYDPGYEKAFYRRAEINIVRKNYTEALNDYDKLLGIVKSDMSKGYIFLYKGNIYDEQNIVDKAFENYKKATSLDPLAENAWYDLGRLTKLKIKNQTLALSFLQKAIDLSTVGDTSSTFVYSMTIIGKAPAAISYELRKIQSSKNDAYRYKWELHNMACILALSGNNVRAADYVDRSLAAGFDDFDHLLNDRDLKTIMNLPQWKAILVKYKVPKPKL
jgi:tetratricopeptide (TPR) repeat protein